MLSKPVGVEVHLPCGPASLEAECDVSWTPKL